MSKRAKNFLAAVVAFAALAVGGAAIAGAATSQSTTTTTAGTSGTQPPPAFNGPAPGTAAHEDAEKAVTGSAATQARAAALKYVGSGTAGEVTTDYKGTGYEVTVTKSDGSSVEVHLDSSFTAMQGFGPPPAA
jgi:hypothetical protein